MSHYPLLVIGEDPAGQLAPYNENTPVAPYLISRPGEWVKALEEAREFYKTEPAEDTDGWADLDFLNRYDSGWRAVGDGFERWTTYNPESRWDWWTVGGRWEGGLLRLDGTRVDKSTLGETDVEEMVSPHAVLRDGKWSQRGRMGWFGVVLDAKEEEEWAGEVRGLLAGLPPETPLTLIDCHI